MQRKSKDRSLAELYTMLENGTADGVSLATLDAIGRALRMSGDERAYLRALAHPELAVTPHERPSDTVLRALAAIVDAPAYVATSQWNVLAWNRAMSVVWNIEAPGAPPFNIVRRMFLDPVYGTIYDDCMGDALFAEAWNAYPVVAPVSSIRTTIESPSAGTFAYEAVTLVVPGDAGHSIVIQVPQPDCAARLRDALYAVLIEERSRERADVPR